jgi:hypothetical protein
MKIKTKEVVSLLFLLSSLISLLCSSGCGYKPFSPIKEDIKKIYIPTFKNSTYHPGVSAVVTDTLIREIILDGTFTLTDEENAQAMLIGDVTDFERSPAIYDEEENIIGGSLTIEVEVRFVSIPEGQIFWKEKMNESGSVNYFLAGSLAKTEDEVTEWAAEKIARRIVEGITEPW